MDQYNSPYRDLQKESWSKGRRCRYWAVSDVSLSKPVPKVKRWLIVEHSFVFFLQGNSSWCLLLLSNVKIGWFFFPSVDTRPSKSGKYLVFLANILPGPILNITDWITTLSLKYIQAAVSKSKKSGLPCWRDFLDQDTKLLSGQYKTVEYWYLLQEELMQLKSDPWAGLGWWPLIPDGIAISAPTLFAGNFHHL